MWITYSNFIEVTNDCDVVAGVGYITSSGNTCGCGSLTAILLKFYYSDFIEVTKADVSSVRPSLEQIKELWVVCGLYTERWSYAIGWCLVT